LQYSVSSARDELLVATQPLEVERLGHTRWALLIEVAAAFLILALLMASRYVTADEVQFGSVDVRSVFFIAKSQNKNQVHYGIRLDRECNPVGKRPVFAYWRMFENQGETEPLLGTEGPAYGLDDTQEIVNFPSSSQVRVRLRAFRDRPVVVTVMRKGDSCVAEASTTIAGADAKLDSMYVKLRWPFGVEYVLVRGSRRVDGRWVQERMME
jgi:hypothetical protein